MDYRITTLDKRHNGHLFYKYSVHPIWESKYTYATSEYDQMFVNVRNWCWQTWGPSTEFTISSRNKHWAWDSEFKHRRIYLKYDEELTFFKLKFNT
jgi:hypothetical protein